MQEMLGQPGGNGAATDLIKDSSTAAFVDDVVNASIDTPVIVDFWAPWCGPCKQLGPILEKVVTAARGAVKLVKIDIDKNPEIAQQLRIQSIPAVFAFVGGRPVDTFQGALPESRIKAFVDKLSATAGTTQADPVGDALAQAKEMLDAGDHAAANSIHMQVIEHDAGNLAARAGLARGLVAMGELAQASEVLTAVPEDKRDDAEIAAAWSVLELAQKSAGAGDLDDLERRVAAEPGDHQARYDLALALYGAGRREAAIDQLIEIIRRDREWNDEAARKELLQLFEAMGPTDPETAAGRRKLSAILFS
jgi:putative thioredoxin